MQGNLLTEPEVAEILSVTVHTVRKWRRQGKIEFIKIGASVRFRPETIRSLIEANLVAPTHNATS